MQILFAFVSYPNYIYSEFILCLILKMKNYEQVCFLSRRLFSMC